MKVESVDTAIELSHQTNTLPEVTGRVCPRDRSYEGACTTRDEHGAATIGNIERYISDQVLAKSWHPDLSHVTKVDERVMIIGAGPTGLACADVLTRDSVAMTTYDHHPEIGGLSTSDTLSLKLDRSLLVRHREIFSVAGIHFELNREVDKDVSLDSLLEQYGAVFVSVGTCRSMEVGLPNEGVPGAYDALPSFIANTKQVMGLEELPGEPLINTAGFDVAVLGGDDTAMDCVRTVLHHGASSVTCVYRCDKVNMPDSKKKVRNTREEGANSKSNVQPVTLELDEQGHVYRTRFLRTRLDGPGTQRHWRPVSIEGSELVMPADMMAMVSGFNPYGMPWLKLYGITVDERGRIIADVEGQYRYRTTNSRIFAGSDTVRDVDLMIIAMAEGRHVAQGIIDWLEAKPTESH